MNGLVIGDARTAGAAWAARPVRERLRVLHKLRRMLGRDGLALAGSVCRPAADTLVAEVLPLAEADEIFSRYHKLAGQPRPGWEDGQATGFRSEAAYKG